jgi:hypothetical protein
MTKINKKMTFALTMLIAFAMVLMAIPALTPSQAKAASNDFVTSVKVAVNASIPGKFDMVHKKLTVKSNTFETYFPALKKSDLSKGVSVADVIVAANKAKYGKKFTKKTVKTYCDFSSGQYGISVKKQFKHTKVGLYYVNKKGLSLSVGASQVKSGNFVEIFSYPSNETAYSELYSKFSKATYKTAAKKTVSVSLTADNFGTAVVPNAGCIIKKVSVKTGKLTSLKTKTNAKGVAKLKFAKKGTYYISATGTVSYTGYNGAVTGNIMCPYAKVIVK